MYSAFVKTCLGTYGTAEARAGSLLGCMKTLSWDHENLLLTWQKLALFVSGCVSSEVLLGSALVGERRACVVPRAGSLLPGGRRDTGLPLVSDLGRGTCELRFWKHQQELV